MSYLASGVGKPLYADKVTEEQQRLGFARVLVEIDVTSDCPKEITICHGNGSNITVVVEYPWLPPKCSCCGGFGHATHSCSNKERKVWIPKIRKPDLVRKSNAGPSKSVPFDRTIRKPNGASLSKGNSGGIRLSNSFGPIGQYVMAEKEEEEEIPSKTPITFLDVFENALSSKDNGKAHIGESSRGIEFSPSKGT